jgi:hypothetical protein
MMQLGFRLAVVLALIAGARTSVLHAQDAPYSQLRMRVAGARMVNHERIHDWWRAGTGAGIAITTPFHVGSIGATATLLPFRARDAGRPNFKALLLGVDWGFALPLPGPFHARAAARVGDFVMLVENPDVWLDSESELLVGGELAAGVHLWRSLALSVTGSFAHVYTRPSLDLAVVSIGLEYATRTPGWMRAILE